MLSGGTGHMLPRERSQASFKLDVLMKLMGTDERRSQLERARELFSTACAPENDPEGEFKCFLPGAEDLDDYKSYEELFVDQIEKTAAAVKLTRENPAFMAAHMAGKVNMGDLFDTNGLAAIHFTMFLSFLKTNGSNEQKKKWLSRTMEASIFGAYAQTELGHGSNLRGLETTATFDPVTDEIEIHSPTLTSTKWWPTGIYSCTHAIVFAQLHSLGKAHGVHGFMVQLRDEHGRCMPGVTVGEIGPKIINSHTCIGYARFDKVRVPRGSMLSRYFQLLVDGSVKAPPAKEGKIKNVTMMMMRVFNLRWAARDCAYAATIATRYSAVRKQGFKDTTAQVTQASEVAPEHTILDYRMQQLRVLSGVSLSMLLFWNANYLERYLARVQQKINDGDPEAADELPELHATCSGLKAFSTTRAHASIEEMRKACGGQGFLRSSGIADIACSFAEPVTVEGEQVILSLQVSRFLIKSVRAMKNNQPLKGSVEYLREPLLVAAEVNLTEWKGRLQVMEKMLRDRAARCSFRLEARFSHCMSKGLSFDEATNETAIMGYEAAAAHSAYIMSRNNRLAILEFVPDSEVAVRQVLQRLLELQMLLFIRDGASAWTSILSEQSLDAIFDRINELLVEIRPDAVAICDSFGASDYTLSSTIGRYDGNVYEAIYEEAQRSPLNTCPVMVGWDKLKPILDIDFLRQGIGQRRVVESKL